MGKSMNYTDIFSALGFDWKTNLESKTWGFEKNPALEQKLKHSVFFYKSTNEPYTSFYLVTTSLTPDQIKEVRRYVWNKNDADLIFYPYNEDEWVMLYAKYSPVITCKESVLDCFSARDSGTIEKIKRWRFESGIFWSRYYSFIKKSKDKKIDKALVLTLNTLKKDLHDALLELIAEKKERNEIVQALIDRTLYIKYLEDNHIINSYFYTHYFQDEVNYKKLLQNHSAAQINELFKIIHKIFNHALFDKPAIAEKFLTKKVCDLIARSFEADLHTKQLRLYDFQFDVLPVELISYIYEIFLSDKQKENGIYYTPKKLAQLIIDEVIREDKKDEISPILDPSCGSGMFLIAAYQKFLEIAQREGLEPEDPIEKIKYRTRLLSENIFGIEKELTAQRFTLFSLSLQIFKGINAEAVKNFIAKELRQNKQITLFSACSFFENIQHANALDLTNKQPFKDKKFSYVVGNPPFFHIPPNTDEYSKEISFLNTYQAALEGGEPIRAKDIIAGTFQISQCFFFKIQDWADENTRLGFVSNSSSFYNDSSEKFQNYFYSHYGIEKLYELSRVKKMLFEKSAESVVAIIFTRRCQNNSLRYYPVDLGLFYKKPFELLIIKEEDAIPIEQKKLKEKKVRLRDFLRGNEYDRQIIKKLNRLHQLKDYIQSDTNTSTSSATNFFIHRGIEVVGDKEIKKEFDINKSHWEKLSKENQTEYRKKFKSRYVSPIKTKDRNVPFLKPGNINKFNKTISSYIGEDISMFRRPREKKLYKGERIVFKRIGSAINAILLKEFMYFNSGLYVLKLKDKNLYNLIAALMNSKLWNYFIDIYLKKRMDNSYPRINIEDVKKLPIPKDLDEDLVNQISDISQRLTEGKDTYLEKQKALNECIYKLYELSYWEKQRIEDHFLRSGNIGKKGALDKYKSTLKEGLRFYFKNPITLEETSTDFNLIVIKLSLNQNTDTSAGSATTPTAGKTKKYILDEIFEQNPNENFLAGREKIYGKDCVYIIKEDSNKNWTETKAYEDGQDLLKHIIPHTNGERIH